MDERRSKYASLLEGLRGLGSLAVAFSGGVDSSFLLAAAREALGDRVLALTALSPAFPEEERREAADFCRYLGLDQTLVEAGALVEEIFRENRPERCYLCKRTIFTALAEKARDRGFPHLAEGSNTDDMTDYRPGMRAIRELGVLSPLREAGLSKAEIRALSRELSLPTWDRPSLACLATRFPYGESVTPEKLRLVEAGERLLRSLGFGQLRLRLHGDVARIELTPAELPRLMAAELRERLCRELHALGLRYVSLDLDGFRSGSMNEALPEAKEG